MIIIPESVSFYWSDPANKAAINILAETEEIPADLTLQETERFALATLAAHRVRVEMWLLLRRLWSATWGNAVGVAFPTARLLTFGEHADFDEDGPVPSVECAWKERATTGVFELPGGTSLFTYLGLTGGDRELELKFYVFDADESNATSDDLDLGADWTDDGESQRITRRGLVRLLGNEIEIDTDHLSLLALEAMKELFSAVM